MMKLPSLTVREVIRKLRKAGFVFDRQAKGSHEIWYNPKTRRRTTVPNHPGATIPKGTLRAIITQSGLTIDEFLSQNPINFKLSVTFAIFR
jgi:predicted RNA binding protein YcfA (HicA-like mRNA interferase family)